MSDQPHTEQRTFWFKCERGHVEERAMPSIPGSHWTCSARYVKVHEGGSGIYEDACGFELRHVGPTVAEWRAANDERFQALADARSERERLERMLGEADAALLECGRVIDLQREQLADVRGQLESAEAEVEHLREHGLVGAAHDADWVLRVEANEYLRERDAARRAKSDASNRLATLRRYLAVESDRQDDRGRHGLANRMREARSASWSVEELASQGVCLPIPEHFDLDEYGEAGIKLGQNWSDMLADMSCADPSNLDPEVRKLMQERTAQPIISDEVILLTGPPPRVERFLGCNLEDWQAIIAEVRSFYSHLSTPTEMLGWLLRDARDAKAEVKRLKQRGIGGFTLVRDVNQQTERERDNERRMRQAAQDDASGLRYEVTHWQGIALWAATSEGALALPAPSSFADRLAVVSAAYEAEMEADSQ